MTIEFLDRYVVDDQDVDYDELRLRLATWSKRAMVHPVFPGSAITGAGVEALMAGIASCCQRSIARSTTRSRAWSSRSNAPRLASAPPSSFECSPEPFGPENE